MGGSGLITESLRTSAIRRIEGTVPGSLTIRRTTGPLLGMATFAVARNPRRRCRVGRPSQAAFRDERQQLGERAGVVQGGHGLGVALEREIPVGGETRASAQFVDPLSSPLL